MWRTCSISTFNEIMAKSKVPSPELKSLIVIGSQNDLYGGVKIIFLFGFCDLMYNSSDHVKPDSNPFLLFN